MLEYSLTVRGTYSDVSGAELDAEVAKVHKEFPGWGNYSIICLAVFKFRFSVFATPNIEWIQKGQSCVNCAICRRESALFVDLTIVVFG